VALELRAFELDQETYARALARETRRRCRGLFIAVGIFLSLVLAVTAWHASTTGSFALLRAWTPLFLLAGAWYWFLVRWVPQKMARDPLNRFQFDTYQVSVSDGQLKIRKSNGARSALPLDQIVRTRRLPRHLLLYESSVSAILIPFSAFRSSDDLAEFEQLLSKEAPGAAA
jgi:hypothetical protein